MTYITCNFGAKPKHSPQPRKFNTEGERKLWVAVLAQIIGDAVYDPNPKRGEYGELRREKELSIAMIENITPDFQFICGLAGMDPRAIRERWLAGTLKDPAHISVVTRPQGNSKRTEEYEARMSEAMRLFAAGMTREQIAAHLDRKIGTINEYLAGGPKNARRKGMGR